MKVQYVLHLFPCTHQDSFLGIFEEFSTRLAVVRSTHSSTEFLTWTSLISLRNTIICFRTHTLLDWTVPLTDATCATNCLYHFLIDFTVGRIVFELSSEFSLSSDHRFCYIKLQRIKRFFHLSFTSVLNSGSKSWNYLLHVHEKKDSLSCSLFLCG
jgi:hypothetical protein